MISVLVSRAIPYLFKSSKREIEANRGLVWRYGQCVVSYVWLLRYTALV